MEHYVISHQYSILIECLIADDLSTFKEINMAYGTVEYDWNGTANGISASIINSDIHFDIAI